MIKRISHKQFRKINHDRLNGYGWHKGIVFEGANGLYYHCTESGIVGGRQVFEFNLQLMRAGRDQTNMISDKEMLQLKQPTPGETSR